MDPLLMDPSQNGNGEDSDDLAHTLDELLRGETSFTEVVDNNGDVPALVPSDESPQHTTAGAPQSSEQGPSSAGSKADPPRRSARQRKPASSKSMHQPTNGVSSGSTDSDGARKQSNAPSRALADKEKQEAEEEDDADDDDDTPYCICRGPDDGRYMIACDSCDEWYHIDCLNLNLKHVRALEATHQTYTCPKCKEPPAKRQKPLLPSVRACASKPNLPSLFSPSSAQTHSSHALSLSAACMVFLRAVDVQIQTVTNSSPTPKKGRQRKRTKAAEVVKDETTTMCRMCLKELHRDADQFCSDDCAIEAAQLAFQAMTGMPSGMSPSVPPASAHVARRASTLQSENAGSRKSMPPAPTHQSPGVSKEPQPSPAHERVRTNFRQRLAKTIENRLRHMAGSEAQEINTVQLAERLEHATYTQFRCEIDDDYRSFLRRLMSNMQDPSGQILDQLAQHKVTPTQVAQFTLEDLLPRSEKREIEEAVKERQEQSILTAEQLQIHVENKKKPHVAASLAESLTTTETDEGKGSSERRTLPQRPTTPTPSTTSRPDTQPALLPWERTAASQVDATPDLPAPANETMDPTLSPALSPVSQTLNRSHLGPGEPWEGKEDDLINHAPHVGSRNVAEPSLDILTEEAWRGTLKHESVGHVELVASLLQRTKEHEALVKAGLRSHLRIDGRIRANDVWSYVRKLREASSKLYLAVQFEPANDEAQIAFTTLIEYFRRNNRFGVVKETRAPVRDMYLIPMAAGAGLPPALMEATGLATSGWMRDLSNNADDCQPASYLYLLLVIRTHCYGWMGLAFPDLRNTSTDSLVALIIMNRKKERRHKPNDGARPAHSSHTQTRDKHEPHHTPHDSSMGAASSAPRGGTHEGSQDSALSQDSSSNPGPHATAHSGFDLRQLEGFENLKGVLGALNAAHYDAAP